MNITPSEIDLAFLIFILIAPDNIGIITAPPPKPLKAATVPANVPVNGNNEK